LASTKAGAGFIESAIELARQFAALTNEFSRQFKIVLTSDKRRTRTVQVPNALGHSIVQMSADQTRKLPNQGAPVRIYSVAFFRCLLLCACNVSKPRDLRGFGAGRPESFDGMPSLGERLRRCEGSDRAFEVGGFGIYSVGGHFMAYANSGLSRKGQSSARAESPELGRLQETASGWRLPLAPATGSARNRR
jgi:hypothetical protein